MVLAAWIILFLIGLYAQSLILAQSILLGLLVYLIVGSAAVLLFYSQKPLPCAPSGETPEDSRSLRFTPIRWLLWLLAAAAIIASLVFINKASLENPESPVFYSYALQGWLAFLALIAVGAAVSSWRDLRAYPKRSLISLAFLLLFSLAIGLFRLTEAPPTVHGDEGMVGLFARKILHGDIATFFSTSWYSIPQFFFFLPSCGLYWFGDDLWGLRMSTVILGTLSVIPFYLLASCWWGTRAAFYAGILLIANHWFVHLMHCGVNYVQVAFFTITLLALWTYANARRSPELLLASGAVMGVSLLSYQANHLLPILWIVSQSYLFILRKIPLRWFLASVIAPIVIAVLTISPLLVNDVNREGRTEMFSARSGGVVIWTPMNRQHVNGVYRANGDFSVVLREQGKRALLAPVLYTDSSMQYHGEWPFLERIGAVLFMMSVAVAAYRFFEPRWLTPAIWISAILLAGGALTVDAPFYPRLAGISTLLFLPIAGLFSLLLDRNEGKWKSAANFAIIALVAVCAGRNLYFYFHDYSTCESVQSVHYSQTQMAKLIQENYPTQYIYVFDGPHFSFNSGTVQFLIPNKGEDLTKIPAVWDKKDYIIVVSNNRSDLLPALKEQFPAYTIREYKTPDGHRLFTTLTQEKPS